MTEQPDRELAEIAVIARSATREYDIEVNELSAVHHGLNTTFRVAAYERDGPRRVFALRVHRPGYHDRAAIESEVAWLRALRTDAGLNVPEPVAARSGTYVVTPSATPGGRGARMCVLSRWINGKISDGPLDARQLSSVGDFVGRLHLHSSAFDPPPGFRRRRWDFAGLCGQAVGASLARAESFLTVSEREVLSRARQAVERTFAHLRTSQAEFGLIHSDLFRANLLFDGVDVSAIDFDGCGWGYYLYDLAVPLADCRHLDDFPERRAALADGYRRRRSLPDELLACLDGLIAARLMVHAIWFSSHLGEPHFRREAPTFLTEHLRLLDAVIDNCAPAANVRSSW